MTISVRMEPKNTSNDASATSAANDAVQNFFSQAQQMWTPMTETLQEQRTLVERGLDDLSKAQEANLRRTREATDEMTEVVKASMNYGIRLSQEWMNLGMAASRRTMAAFANTNTNA